MRLMTEREVFQLHNRSTTEPAGNNCDEGSLEFRHAADATAARGKTLDFSRFRNFSSHRCPRYACRSQGDDALLTAIAPIEYLEAALAFASNHGLGMPAARLDLTDRPSTSIFRRTSWCSKDLLNLPRKR
jgi:hypothetical protein